MQNKWLTWGFVIGVVVIIVFAVNYNSQKKDIPLSEIFPEESMGIVVNQETPPSAAEMISAEVNKKTQEVQQIITAPVMEAKTATATSATHTLFSIQIASFKEKAKAEKILQQVQSKGYTAQIVTRDLGAQGIWYRVCAGSFDNKSQATEALPSVQTDFPGSFIIAIK